MKRERERGHETCSKAIAIRGICGGGHAALGRAGRLRRGTRQTHVLAIV